MRTYHTLKELEENSTELPESIANHPMLTPMSKLVKESPVSDKKAHDAGHRDGELLKKHKEEGGKSSVEKDAYPQDTSVPPEAKNLKSIQDVIRVKRDEPDQDIEKAKNQKALENEEVVDESLGKALNAKAKKMLDKASGQKFKYDKAAGLKRPSQEETAEEEEANLFGTQPKARKSGWRSLRQQNEPVEEGVDLQVKMALSDVDMKYIKFMDGKVYVKKNDVAKAKKALKGNVIYKGKTPEVIGEDYEEVESIPPFLEAKEEQGFYVKYATSKRGPISQVFFSDKTQAEAFLQKINKMGAKGIISDKPTKGGIPMGHRATRQQQEVEVIEEGRVDLKKLRKEWDKNEDRNYHAENYLLLAKAFGTPSEIKKVEAIVKQNNKQGHADQKSNDWMYKNIMPYYQKIRNVHEVEPVDEGLAGTATNFAWKGIDWNSIADLAKSNPKKFKKKSDWVDWVNRSVKPDNPQAAAQALKAWEHLDYDGIKKFINEQCQCQQQLNTNKVADVDNYDGRTKAFRATKSRIEGRLAKIKERLRNGVKEAWRK